MNTPNTFSKTDLYAARELVKGWMNRAFWNAIDRGEMDAPGIGIMDRAKAEVIRARKDEEQADA